MPARRLTPWVRQAVSQIRLAWRLRGLSYVDPERSGMICVSYAHGGFPAPLPGPDVILGGGAVKYRYLDAHMPHAGLACSILYAVSSSHCANMALIMRAAQRRGIKVVWNQNGVYTPAAYGTNGARRGNAQMAPLLQAADYVFYQSHFAQESATRFLGGRKGPSEVLYNAIDTRAFSPGQTPPERALTLLVSGSHNDSYRLPTAIHTLAAVNSRRHGARLIVAGRVPPPILAEARALAMDLDVEGQIEFLGPYTQQAAPGIYRRAHILLHTQYNDVCPSVVLEALASGLPVVYSRSGGTPELVGEEAGYGVPAARSWNEAQPPDAEQLAEGIMAMAENWLRHSEAARERAVSRFDLRPWIARHVEVFERLR